MAVDSTRQTEPPSSSPPPPVLPNDEDPTNPPKEEEENGRVLPRVNARSYLDSTTYSDGNKPESAFELALDNFRRQGSSLVQELLEETGLKLRHESYVPRSQRLPDCLGFTLDNEAVKEAEHRREVVAGQKVETNVVSRWLYDVGCFALDELFPGRPIARFWFLEIIARIPYFSYVSMLHLYESFGWWREPELRKIHYAEEYNELHHLLIMEALGGNARWRDRFLGYHVAFGYYWAINGLFLCSPKAAYEFMELLESHAVDTYGTFVKENKERLVSLPAPQVAIAYYQADNPYMFDDFQVSKKPQTRTPPCGTLYDVFQNICQDEGEHVKTMNACKHYADCGSNKIVSPHWNPNPTRRGNNNNNNQAVTEDDEAQKRREWLTWSEEVNRACTSEEDF